MHTQCFQHLSVHQTSFQAFVKMLNNISTELLKWCPMLRQMQESTLHQTLHVRVDSYTQKSHSPDWLKWCCVLWHYVISLFFLNHMSLQMVRQMVCRYVNFSCMIWLVCLSGMLGICLSFGNMCIFWWNYNNLILMLSDFCQKLTWHISCVPVILIFISICTAVGAWTWIWDPDTSQVTHN